MTTDSTAPLTTQFALLGGGCFWCTEAVFLGVRGVLGVTSGYAGGHHPQPTYELICAGQSGHAEVVRIEFDPAQVSYAQLLAIFFATHDPTTRNRQGNDVGTQYRSVIFYYDATQAQDARASLEIAQAAWDAPIVTELAPAPTFFAAERYHQNYFARNPQQGYCAFVVAPKVAKFRHAFAPLLR